MLTYEDLLGIEQLIRTEVFTLINSPYVKFIFQINVSFGQKRMRCHVVEDAPVLLDAEFVANWRDVKLLELSAIANGDQEVGILAANRSRALWRVVSQFQRPGMKQSRSQGD